MLSVACPSCGAPAPVSLATPDSIACGNCHHQGPSSPELSRELRAAADALWQMDAADRQLSGAQRLNVASARSYLVFLSIGLGAVLLPLMLLAGGCVALFGTAESFEPGNLLFIALGALPLVLGLGASLLALRHVHRRGAALVERCAAVPPVAQGHPARCHVCGGPLEVHARQGIVRCGFCQADNLVSRSVLSRLGARRQARIGQLLEQVQGEARALDQSAMAAGAAAFATVLLAPVVGFVLLVGIVIAGTATETEPLPDAVYALAPYTNTRCVVRVVRAGSGEVLEHGTDRPVGAPERSAAPSGLERVRGAELAGRELGLEGSRRGKVKRLYRTLLARSFDYVELETDGRLESQQLVGRCEVSARRRVVASDARLDGATRMRADGDRLLISAGGLISSVPKAGGAASPALASEGYVVDFQPKGARVYVLQSSGATTSVGTLERREGEQVERLADEVSCFALDGDELWVGKQDGLHRRSASGQLTRADATAYVSRVVVESDAVYFSDRRGEIRELTKASGRVRVVGKLLEPQAMARVGQYLYVADKVYKAGFLPLGGGERVALDGINWAPSEVRTDGQAVYFGVVTSGRGGVVSVVPGRKDASGARHYGIDTREPKAFAVDGGQVFWVDGSSVLSEPVLPP